MRLTSNIAGIVSRLEELQAGYPAAVRRALAPDYWRPHLVKIAEATLSAHVWSLGVTSAQDVQTRATFQRLIPVMVKSILGTPQPYGALFQMWLPPESVTDLNFSKAAGYAADQWTPMGRDKRYAMPDAHSADNLKLAKQAVLDWVELEKNRDERDVKADGSMMSSEEIAARLEIILGLRPRMGVTQNDGMASAASELTGAIQAWLAGADTTPSGTKINSPPVSRPSQRTGLSHAQAAQWLGAVLAAWVSFVRSHLRARVEAELNKLHQRVATPQRSFL